MHNAHWNNVTQFCCVNTYGTKDNLEKVFPAFLVTYIKSTSKFVKKLLEFIPIFLLDVKAESY